MKPQTIRLLAVLLLAAMLAGCGRDVPPNEPEIPEIPRHLNRRHQRLNPTTHQHRRNPHLQYQRLQARHPNRQNRMNRR